MSLFKRLNLVQYADFIVLIKTCFSLNFIDITFQLFNIEFKLYIPLFDSFYHVKTFLDKTILSPFSKKYENKETIKKRWWNFNLDFGNNLDTGFTFSIPYSPRDHDDRGFSISLLGFTFSFTSYHSWHVCCCKNGIERFPTDDELEKYGKYCDRLYEKLFGKEKISNINQNELKTYWKKTEEKYNNIPYNDDDYVKQDKSK